MMHLIQDSLWIQREKKAFIQFFGNILNVFTDTLIQFNASLRNKMINLYKIILNDLKPLNSIVYESIV